MGQEPLALLTDDSSHLRPVRVEVMINESSTPGTVSDGDHAFNTTRAGNAATRLKQRDGRDIVTYRMPEARFDRRKPAVSGRCQTGNEVDELNVR